MSFITNSDRIFITDGSGNVKFDTNRKYPFIIGSITGTQTFTNTVTAQTVTVAAGESFTSSTAYFGSEIDSTRILLNAPYPINFCFSAITLNNVSNAGVSPGGAFYYDLITVGKTYAINGSLLVELQVSANGRVMRVAQITCYANASNQVVMHFKRSAYNNDVAAAASFTFGYTIQYGRIT